MDEAPRNTMLLHLANGTLEGAAVRVLDVAILTSDAKLLGGYPSRVSVGPDPALFLTAHGIHPATGEDTRIDIDDAIWAWAVRKSAGSGPTETRLG